MTNAIVRALNEFQARAWRKNGKVDGWRQRLFFAVADRLVESYGEPGGVQRRDYP